MMKRYTLHASAVLLLCFSTLSAQVQIDKPIQLTGSGSDAKIEGIKEVSNDDDAASKKYVDTTLAGSAQTLSINCDTIFISNGNYIIIPGLGSQFFSVAANAGPDYTGPGTSLVLSGNNPGTASGQWSIQSGSGGSFVDDTDPTTTFNGVSGNTYTLRWTITNSCNTDYDEVVVYFVTPFNCGTSSVTDVEGNSYTTVLIGSQCWMKQSMRTTKYPNGSNITKGPVPSGSAGWDTDNAYYSCPGNLTNTAEDCAAASEVGMVYQWSALMNGSTTEGVQGICPTGWHVPTDTEWKTMEGALGMSVSEQNSTVWRGTNEASKMANNVPGRNWDPGNLTSDGSFGSSGLDIPGSGYRYTNGNYVSVGSNSEAYIATSTQASGTNMWVRTLYSGLTQVNRSNYSKARAISVRCVKD